MKKQLVPSFKKPQPTDQQVMRLRMLYEELGDAYQDAGDSASAKGARTYAKKFSKRRRV